MTKKQLVEIKKFSKPFYKKVGRYHDWSHIAAVKRNALFLAKRYKNVDRNILEAACYVHDVGRSVKDDGHAGESVKIILPFLKRIGISDSDRDDLCHAIACHDKKKIKSARTLEAKILFDADKLEILSVFGFLRVMTWLVEERKMDVGEAVVFLWDWCRDVLENYMQTGKGRAIARGEMRLIKKMVDRFLNWDKSLV